MENTIIQGMFLLIATLMGSGITFLATRSKDKVITLTEKLKKSDESKEKLLRQIEAYHHLEAKYAEAIAESENKKVKTVKEHFRDMVVEQNQCDRPTITANEARNRLQSKEI